MEAHVEQDFVRQQDRVTVVRRSVNGTEVLHVSDYRNPATWWWDPVTTGVDPRADTRLPGGCPPRSSPPLAMSSVGSRRRGRLATR